MKKQFKKHKQEIKSTLTNGDWSEIWLTLSTKETLSLSSLELSLEPLLKTSGVEDLFLFESLIYNYLL